MKLKESSQTNQKKRREQNYEIGDEKADAITNSNEIQNL